MSKHSIEPWRLDGGTVVSADGIGVTRPIERFDDAGLANGLRIVAAVNALAGVPDPAAYVAAARAMREALDDIASGMLTKHSATNAEAAQANRAIECGDKAAFNLAMLRFSQSIAKSALKQFDAAATETRREGTE